MAQLDEAAAVAEADVVETAPENSAVETADTSAEDFYREDQSDQSEEAEELDGDDEPEEEAEAIEAPASLKAEEKEQFAQLPPEAQRFTADLLARRDRETQQGLEAARSAQRDAERAAADQTAQTQQAFAQKFAGLVQAFAPQPPPLELARENPAEYTYQQARYSQEMADFNALVGEIESLNGQSDQHFAARRQEWMADQMAQLRSIPEIADDATRPQFIAGITALGKEMGYSDEQLAQVDAKDVLALNKARVWKQKADKWDAHSKKRNERPRAVSGRFSAAPVGGGGTAPGNTANNTLKALYPND